MWPDRRVIELFGVEHPILLAPMAGPGTAELAIAVAEAGGLGAIPCAMLQPDEIRANLQVFRRRTSHPINLNFFTHKMPEPDALSELRWRQCLAPYYAELGIACEESGQAAGRAPFDAPACEIIEEFRPEVVSFHFGLPEASLLARVVAAGSKVIATATTVREARWLEDNGCVAIIAQGFEAGGHRGMFLSNEVATQVGTMALVPQIVDAVRVPVVAAGGIADARGIAAAFALGAAGVQIGTAYLFCPEARTSVVHKASLLAARDDDTALTNIFTGRPARGMMNRIMRELGPISNETLAFRLAVGALMPLKVAAGAKGVGISPRSGRGRQPLCVLLCPPRS